MEQIKVSFTQPESPVGQLVQTRFEQRSASLLVEYDNDETPDLPVGQVVRLVISGANLEDELTIPARPTFQSRGRRSTFHYQIGLVEGAVIGNAMTRRNEVRIRPEQGAPIGVTARDTESLLSCKPRLQDISPTGAGILMTLQEEAQFAHVWNLVLGFTLPGSEKEVELEGAIQYRKLEGSLIRLGIKFTGNPENDPSGALEAIRTYVEERRAQLLALVQSRSTETASKD